MGSSLEKYPFLPRVRAPLGQREKPLRCDVCRLAVTIPHTGMPSYPTPARAVLGPGKGGQADVITLRSALSAEHWAEPPFRYAKRDRAIIGGIS